MRIPRLGPDVPKRRTVFWSGLGRLLLRWFGWKIEGEIPNLPKFVAIAAPHTSNWDFFFGICAVFALGIRVHWIGKHTLFKRPFGWFMRWLGGTPVDRSLSTGVVQQMADVMRGRERFVFGLSPEGTRKRVERWRTGFYYVALEVGVPILPCYFDYERKAVGIGPPFEPTGDAETDIKALRDFYADKVPRFPERF